eukprot:6203022-Pleurochrysis_carterae.AAC.1
MHDSVYVRKDEHGDVRVWLRASSQGTTWFRDGPGYRSFTSIPEGEPILAKVKSDVRWSRTIVEGTIRSWFRYMVVETATALTKINDERESRFSSLPPVDGNINELPTHIKPQWFELPHCWNQHHEADRAAGRAAASSGPVISSHLENSPVNPTTGPGPTSADVQQEARAWREHERNAPASLRYPAVYQTDYLFLRGLELHRVALGLIIADRNAPVLSFSTVELAHTPNPDVPGFWGMFSPKPNPGYNP